MAIRSQLARIALTAALMATVAVGTSHAHGQHPARILVRWCPEDAVQLGRGDFDGTRWERYICKARDDFKGGNR